MTRRDAPRSAAGLLLMLLFTACGVEQSPPPANAATDTTGQTPQELLGIPQLPHAPVCAMGSGHVRCFAWAVTDSSGSPAATSLPAGLLAADLRDAYKIPTFGGEGITVAVVDQSDDPNAEADLAVYRAQNGLPPCTTANGCFTKVNGQGQRGNYPAGDTGWGVEISLDLDMVSAACPRCRILLVEADVSNSLGGLLSAEGTAVALGAKAISNSWGLTEDGTIGPDADAQYFNHPGVSIFASAGDTGYGVLYPASSQYVTAVGGTSLVASTGSSRGWTEGLWGHRLMGLFLGGTGSGCSAYTPKPSWEHDTGCSTRMVADVSAVADPSTGVAVYDSFGQGGWMVVGGTSAASPLVAGIYAATGHAGEGPAFAHAHPEAFVDERYGSNGWCLFQPGYFCNAEAGFDGPSGWGTPNGEVLARISP